MMRNSVRLEGFDAPADCMRILPFDGPESEFSGGAPDVMLDPVLEPDLPNELDNPTAEEDAHAEALQLLASTLSTMTQRVDQLHAGLSETLSSAIGEAVLKSLPSVLEEGFAAEVAEVTRSIMSRTSETRMQLRIAALHHDHLVEAFDGLAPILPIEIIDDEALGPGQARLEWETGGADFDSDDWSEAARTALKRHLEHRSTRRRDDD